MDTRAGKALFALSAVCMMSVGFATGAADSAPDWTKGFEAPLEPRTAPETAPPVAPARWHVLPGYVMGEDDVWGWRVNPLATYKVPGGMLLFYQSRPDEETRHDEERLARLREEGLAPTETGSLAFAEDLFTWHDHPANPVLNEVRHSWQSRWRVLLQDVVYDTRNNHWVAFFGDRNGEYPGIRAVGVAYSEDGIHWDYVDRPILTIDDYIAMAPAGALLDSVEGLHGNGRVYVSWCLYREGRFFVMISGTNRGGDEREYGRVLLTADSPEGPFTPAAEPDKDAFVPASKPVPWNGKWYSVYTDTWDGQPGFGLAVSGELAGPYEKLSAGQPIIAVDSIERTSPLLFHHDGVWGVLFTGGGHWSEPLLLRMALVDFDPSMGEGG